MSDKTPNPLLAFFGLDGARAGATLGWVLPVMALPLLLLAGMSYGLSFLVEIPLSGHLGAIGGAGLVAFFTLARLRATMVAAGQEEDSQESSRQNGEERKED